MPGHGTPNSPSAAADALFAWPENDYEAASAWFNEQRRQGSLESKSLAEDAEAVLTGGLIAAAAKYDLNKAIAMLNESSSMKTAEFAMSKIVQRMLIESANDRDRIHEFAQSLESEEFRVAALKRYALMLDAFTDFETSAAFAEGLDLPAGELNKVINDVASVDLTGNASDRLNWLISNSAPQFIDENVKDFIFQWSVVDPNRAAEWAQSCGDAQHRDGALEAITLGHLARNRVNPAEEWATRIQDETRRERVLKRVDDARKRTGAIEAPAEKP